MKIIFLHTDFPAQFVHLASQLARIPGNQVVFITMRKEGNIPGVRKLVIEKHREARRETHHYLQGFEKAILQGQAVYRELVKLKSQGFRPDVVYGHSGWGMRRGTENQAGRLVGPAKGGRGGGPAGQPGT